MELFDEEILKPKKRKKIKSTTIIAIVIAILIILCVIVIATIVYLRNTILTVTLDNVDASDLESIFIIEENNKIYIPIRKMGEYLKYNTYNGDYITRSEDTDKCYIENEEELVSFELNSNILTKVVDGQSQQIKINEPITQINGELCINSDGAQDAFNIVFEYNTEKNNINIQTLTYLYMSWSNYAKSKGYTPIEEETFENKTAILDNMIIVKNSNENYGVINTSGEIILETKYDDIKYLRKTSDFLVSSNGKKGIISEDKTTKISLIYDNIQEVTNNNDIFYIIQSSNLYGVLDVNGDIVIHPEYAQIGIDVSAYDKNGVTNGYILFNKIIPVKNNNKWAIFDIEGNKITDFIYDALGCSNSKVPNTYGVLEIKDFNLLVVNLNGKYGLITLEGKDVLQNILDSVYISVTSGNSNYYITYGDQTIQLIEFLQERGIKKVEET